MSPQLIIHRKKIRVKQTQHSSDTNPAGRGKVDSFGKVVALVEAGMIRAWKRDNKFTGLLIRPYNLQHTSTTRITLYYSTKHYSA